MMAKSSTKANPSEPTTVTITYDIFDLPTAQHKAGLAGLLLQIESMNNRKRPAPEFKWDDQEPTTKVHVMFTEETTASLFDDLYDATWIEGAPREKPFFKGKGSSKKEIPPIRRASITKTDKKGNEKIVEGYVYLELTPALPTLRHYLPEKGEWVRLWRDLIWQVIRDSKKKAPFILRAAAKLQPEGATLAEDAEAESADAEEGEKGKADGSTWADLIKHQACRMKGEFGIGRLSSALLLGAQSFNAEAIPFAGRIDHNALLHFWPLTAMVYIPRFIDRDGNSHIGRRDKDDKSQHFCVAIPEVTNLRGFLVEYPLLLSALSSEVALYRPSESLIDIPAEGGLSFIEHLSQLGPQAATSAETQYSISGVDYLHLNKDGNNVKYLASGRVAVSPDMMEQYQCIVGRPGEKPPFANPLFRRGLMFALLENQPWYRPFGKMFAEWPHKFFIPSDDPPKLSWFWADARKKLQEVFQTMPTECSQPPPDPNDKLAELIYRLVRTYLSVKASDKSGINPDDHKEGGKVVWDRIPQRYKDDRRQIGESMFMEYRSRRDQAFVDHFVARLGAVKQFIGEDDYLAVSRALSNDWEKVKTLTLLALSANS